MKDEMILKNTLNSIQDEMRTNNIEGLKYAMKRFLKRSLHAVEEIQKNSERSNDRKKLKRKIELLRHELDHLRRFCGGAV